MTPPWKRSGEGFLIKIDDFLRESSSQSSAQREFPSRGGLGGEFLIKIENFNKESFPQSPTQMVFLSGGGLGQDPYHNRWFPTGELCQTGYMGTPKRSTPLQRNACFFGQVARHLCTPLPVEVCKGAWPPV